jgi:D-3-phosphoglycerate dehydrogenase
VNALVAGTEILINAVALAPQTKGLLNAEVLALLPAGALVISNSRGGIVDEDAVVEMLKSGALAGAAFDVYGQEPLPAGSPLLALKHDRLLLSPHAAGSTVQSNVALIQGVAANIGRAVSGAEVKDVVNGVSPLISRR